jgi:hypothetical protein
MTDDKDRRIAELEAQLAKRSEPEDVNIKTVRARGGFAGGFYGCFGVLAAVVVMIVAVLALGKCAQETSPSTSSSSAAATTPTTPAMSHWDYSTSSDAMTSKKESLACIDSIDTVQLSFPYHRQGGELCVRRSLKFGLDVYMKLADSGQFSCAMECSVLVRFDSQPARRFSAAEAADGSTGIIFIRGAPRFIAAARKAKTIRVEASYFQNGVQYLTFKTEAPLDWK